MAGIKDLNPSSNAGGSVGTSAQTVIVHHGEMTNGIPTIHKEPFNTIDEAINFAGPLAGTQDILFIEYRGLKLGVNL
jgi:hypothetical protein